MVVLSLSWVTGTRARACIHGGTGFMDNSSSNNFKCLQYSNGGIEIIAAKRLYELYAGSFGVNSRYYHANNGIFE